MTPHDNQPLIQSNSMSLTETKIFRKDDVWLVEFAGEPMPLAILKIKDGWIQTKFSCRGFAQSWMSADEFNKRSIIKLGTVRRFLGIPIGIRQ